MYRIKRGLLLYNSGAVLNDHMYPAFFLLSTSGLGQAYIINANVAPRSGIGFFLQCYIAKGCFDLTLNPGFQFQDFVLPLWRTIGRKACKDFTCDTDSKQTKNAHCLYCCQHMSRGGGEPAGCKIPRCTTTGPDLFQEKSGALDYLQVD